MEGLSMSIRSTLLAGALTAVFLPLTIHMTQIDRKPQAAAPSPDNTDSDTLEGGHDQDPTPPPRRLTPQQIRDRLTADSLTSKYAGTPNLSQFVEFQTVNSSDVLVFKNGGGTEFTMRGVFQIARNDFYLTPDGSYNPDNKLQIRFQDVKLNCRLTAPSSSSFLFAQDDFPTCIDNLKSFEKIIRHDETEEVKSCVTGSILRGMQFKILHGLFELKPPSEVYDDRQDDDTKTSDSVEELGDEFTMDNWPVAPRCADHLDKLLPTHDLCPLPAYDINGKLIPPRQYVSMLKGAIVEAHLSFTHYYIGATKHVYNVVVRRLEVLREPDAPPTSPYKRLRVSASPEKSKGKHRAY